MPLSKYSLMLHSTHLQVISEMDLLPANLLTGGKH